MSSENAIHEKLLALQTRFHEQLPGKLTDIEQQWADLCDGKSIEQSANELHRLVHSLAGTAGTFGAHAVSHIARELEQTLKQLAGECRLPDVDERARIAETIARMEESASTWHPPALSTQRRVGTGLTRTLPTSKLVYLVDDDELVSRELGEHLAKAGFTVERLNSLAAFRDALARAAPDAIIMDMMFAEGKDAGADAIVLLREKLQSCPPVIFVSTRTDIQARLAAVRAGAIRYFSKPLDITRLTTTLNGLTSRTPMDPFRVLVVDDDQAIGGFFCAVLKEAGIETRHLMDPLLGLQAIAEFKPDLVLMDVYMPGCTGLELAAIIRQDDDHAHMPVVFLSAESDLDKQLHALNLGGDEFLTKPIEPSYLVEAVGARLKRARHVQRLDRELNHALTESTYQQVTLNEHAIVSITDRNGDITWANDHFCRVSGYTSQELIGRNHRIVNSGQHPPEFFRDLWETISKGGVWHGDICNRAKDGRLYWVNSTIVPFLDAEGIPYKYVSARTDITPMKLAEQKLRSSEERLRRSQVFANIGTWDWNISSGDLYWSERIAPLFGYEEDKLATTYENFLNSVHPDDRESVIRAVNDCVQKGKEYYIEHRCVWPDGTTRWLLEQGDVVRGDDSEPLHMLGVVQDITRRKQLEETLANQGSLLNILRHAMTEFVSSRNFRESAAYLLNGLLKLTGSQFGFTGEILYDEQGQRYLQTHAISNIAWNDETREVYENGAATGMMFSNLNTLFGYTVRTGEVVISNQPANDPRATGLPEGHPEVNSYLGVPLYYGDELVGMYAIANREGGYQQELVEFLYPFNATYGVLIDAKRTSESERNTRRELQDSKEDAERANRAKSEFLSSMSHELRTPMNAILGFGQLLEMEELNETQRENVEEILHAGNHLLDLINEVLDLAKVEAGRISLSIEAVDLADVLQECLALMQPQVSARGLNVSLSHAGESVSPERVREFDCVVRADRTRLKQVVLNLLSNATKYNSEHGRIGIDVSRTACDDVRIAISDTGAGIPRERQAELFTSFNRLGAEHSDIEGTGIGLVISKNIVELMGGAIGFESTPGQGSCFWIDLEADELAVARQAEDTQDANALTAVTADKEQVVLYIEDNPANLKLVSRLLGKRPNVHLLTAHTPELGLQLANQRLPGIILLDINLPGMDGYEALQVLRLNPKLKNSIVIAVSANAMPGDIEKGLAAGFNDYITKPIDVGQFFSTLDKVLSRD